MLAIRAGRAFDGERVLHGGALVLVDGQRIVAVASGAAPAPHGCQLVEFPTGAVLPGLIDMHVHLCGDAGMGALDRLADYTDAELDEVIAASLRQQLAAGVTTVRDLGDRRYAVVDWWNARRTTDSTAAWPTVVAAGPPITSRRGHCWNMGGEATGAAQLRAAVHERADRGVDVVKVMASGGVMTSGSDVMRCQFEADELRLVVEEAHAAGLPVTAHAHGVPSVEQAISAGVDGIEHASCLGPTGVEMTDQLLQRLAAQQITVCPTLGKTPDAVPPPTQSPLFGTWEARQRNVGRMSHAGVRLVSGTDAGIRLGKPHGILPDAIADLVAGGIPATAALASATSVAAESAGLKARKGRLQPGCDADLVVIDGDPVADIAALTRVLAVVCHGHLI